MTDTQATLPDRLRKGFVSEYITRIRTEIIDLKDMIDGECGYTAPWAMYADSKGRLWLEGDYPVCLDQNGSSTLMVKKVDGKFIVDVSKCKYDNQWIEDEIFRNNPNLIPVSKITGY